MGVILIPFGLLIAWGGIGGNLAAILAAMFAPNQLVVVSGTTMPLIPPPAKVPDPADEPTTVEPPLDPGGYRQTG